MKQYTSWKQEIYISSLYINNNSVAQTSSAHARLYHDAAGEVVEDGCLQVKVLPPDDGVGQGQLQEERLEDCDLLTGCQTETLVWEAESLCLPGGDGVRDS